MDNRHKEILSDMRKDSMKFSIKMTGYVLAVSLAIYVPVCMLCAYLFYRFNFWALPVWLVAILSAFPFAKYIVTPRVNEKMYDRWLEVHNMMSSLEADKYEDTSLS